MKAVLTRVEGEGSIVIYEKEGFVESVVYEITEAPRFFEYFVRGKSPEVVVDVVSRICGICGTSYNFVASLNFEQCFGISIPQEVLELKEALHLAERVKSHILHLFYLNLPDLVRVKSFAEFLQRNAFLARNAMTVLTWSRRVMEVLGGRMHNVVNMKIGGVHRMPDRDNVMKVSRELGNVMKSFLEFANFVLSIKLPEVAVEPSKIRVHQVCLQPLASEYPHHSSKVVVDGDVHNLTDFYGGIVKYLQVPYSTAIHCRIKGEESYIVGPLARFNQFYANLHKEVRDFVESYGWKPPLTNVLHTYVARVAELYDALLILEKFFETYRPVSVPEVRIPKGEFVCEYAVEAPRGILYHKYVVRDGKVVACDIIAPTTQNVAAMNDIATATLKGRKVSEEAVSLAKKIAVAFDPCISCSVHALKVKVIQV